MRASFKQKLLQKKCLVGTLVTMPCSTVAEVLSSTGFDWLFIDMEHAPISTADVQCHLQACDENCSVIVRIPDSSETSIRQALDTGCDGIIAPLIDSPEKARRIVSSAKYPPTGTRSVGIARAHGYGRNFTGYVESANRDISVIVQIEHIDAVKCIDHILAVEGIDGVFIGPYDLSGSMGIPGQTGERQVREAIEKVRVSCNQRNIPHGIFVGNVDAAVEERERGAKFIAIGLDVGRLIASSVADLDRLS